MANLWQKLMIGALAGAAVGAAVVLGRRRDTAEGARQALERSIKEHTHGVHPSDIAAGVRNAELPERVRETTSRLAESPVGVATRHAGQVIADTARRTEKRAEKYAHDHAHRGSSGHRAE
ncbi:hypothetical protein [Prescottella agglutinans]|uniref:hypothetical protein n=1 Tax=Prescottella agglutinans TaxID=1644129 RepID=UPI003D99A7BE